MEHGFVCTLCDGTLLLRAGSFRLAWKNGAVAPTMESRGHGLIRCTKKSEVGASADNGREKLLLKF